MMIMVMMMKMIIMVFASPSVILFPRVGRTKQHNVKRSCCLMHSCIGGRCTTMHNNDNYHVQRMCFQRTFTCVTSSAPFHCSVRKLLLLPSVY